MLIVTISKLLFSDSRKSKWTRASNIGSQAVAAWHQARLLISSLSFIITNGYFYLVNISLVIKLTKECLLFCKSAVTMRKLVQKQLREKRWDSSCVMVDFNNVCYLKSLMSWCINGRAKNSLIDINLNY